jgi:AbrB family looped-hinge helix DNA binding protein
MAPADLFAGQCGTVDLVLRAETRVSYNAVRHQFSKTLVSTSTVSTKGQVVIPADVRADLGIDAGTRVEFVKTPDGWLLKPATRPVTALKGMLDVRAVPATVEDMNRAIRARSARRR